MFKRIVNKARSLSPTPVSENGGTHKREVQGDDTTPMKKFMVQYVGQLRNTRDSIVRVGSQIGNQLMDAIEELENLADQPPTPDDERLLKRATNYDHVREAALYNLTLSGALEEGSTNAPGLVGFRNIGNSCYINSTLQCLSNTVSLTEYFLGYNYRKEINKINNLGSGGEIAIAYADLMKKIWLKPSKGGKERRVMVTKAFKKKLSRFAPRFSGEEQHDAQEFLISLLDGIHEDLNRVKHRVSITDKDCNGTNDDSDAIEAWENYLKRNKSVIVDLFQGQYRSMCTCKQCGYRSVRFEPFMFLSLPIDVTCKTLEDCLSLFTAEEELTGPDKWYCIDCKEPTEAAKKTDIWVLPPVLVVHLKRFKYGNDGGHETKINTSLKYPIAGWNLSTFVRSRNGDFPLYELYAMANHIGKPDDGHYTAYAVNRFDEQWYEFDDNLYSVIDPVSTFAESSSPYVLFFNRVSPTKSHPGPRVNRQSVTLPHLWPHMQVGDETVVQDYVPVGMRKMGKLSTLNEVEPSKKEKKKRPNFGAKAMQMLTATIRFEGIGKTEEEGKKKKKKKEERKFEMKRATDYGHVSEVVMENLKEAGCFEDKGGAPAGVVGLRNLGNTCFMAASLQCLSNTVPLADYFLGFDYKSELNEANPLGTSGELTRKYATLMKKMWLKTSPKRRVLVTQGFKKILAKFAPRFSGTDQQDAQEFLAYLLDGIHEDLNRVKIKPPVEFKDCDGTNDELDAIQAWHDHLLRDKSLIVDLFQGQLRSCTECRRCKLKNVRFEPFMYLSLPIDNSCQSLDDCLSLFTDEEQLIGDNKWFCHRCGEHVNATKKTDIWAMPPILIVHLKRFIYDEYDDGVKNEMELSYPILDWDLADAVKSRGAGKPLYDLYAVANHWGELGYGHYTAYARNRMANEWYEFDDSAYQVIDIKAALEGSSTPYLLFYQMTAGDTSTKGDYTIHRQSAGLPLLYPHLENKMAKVVIETNEEGDDEDEDEEEHDGPFVRMAGRRQSAGLPSLAGGIAPGQETKSSGMMKGRLSLRVVEEEDGEDFEAVA